ncbi:MAG: hypothetical protein IID54_07720 [Proteobacteria bacterium]|nr:hypothetical protein [Pseudomonadota bacterium]
MGKLLVKNDTFAANLRRTIDHVKRIVPEDGRFLVYNRAIHNNYVMLYYLAERQSATRYHDMVGEIASSEAGQRRIVEELGQFDVDLIVESLRSVDAASPPKSDILHRHIQENFFEEERYGIFRILRRGSDGQN